MPEALAHLYLGVAIGVTCALELGACSPRKPSGARSGGRGRSMRPSPTCGALLRVTPLPDGPRAPPGRRVARGAYEVHRRRITRALAQIAFEVGYRDRSEAQ